ncbi:Hypothetical protein CINCED_3A014386 [Cinara cedri]|uniref:Tc1-like transposase DDE domain-containing protein n=1 Tax=Cinara cedri TaxID=506608 RepID=A0A5E4M7L3_9HEMI|nr:Hypothetical protein CINCED_3A014386 [Cinara cedri]
MNKTANEAAQVVALMESGMRQYDVARQLNMSRFAVRRVFQETIKRLVALFGGMDQADNASERTELQQQLHAVRSTIVSFFTVRRRLGEQKIVARGPATGPKLTAQLRKERKTELVCVSWTGGARGQGSLNSYRYITEILEEHVVPYAGFFGDGFILMHENAHSHAALIGRNYTEEVGIPVMNWPSRSLDINQIEHLWDELKRRVRPHDSVPTTLQVLKNAVIAQWMSIPQ